MPWAAKGHGLPTVMLTVAGREISDPLQSWHDYAARTRTLAGYDLAGAGYPGRLTKDEIAAGHQQAMEVTR